MPHPIEIQNLRLRYPETGRVVLHGIDMVVRQGEVKLLLGPSGSGKSSLALTLNGLIPHQMEGEIRGVVLINGVDTTTTQVAALTTQVGLLFQDPDAQIATLTVADEVAFGMENLRVPPAEMPARIDTALARVDMAGMNGRGTDALSGGQKQRLSLASTLAMGAAILVFDEPTANLDPAGTTSFFDLLSRLKAEGATILIIEHKLDDLIARVDSVAVLGLDGKIAADGPPTQVLQEQRELLHELGVWVPQVTELANALTTCDVTLNPYPLTIEDAVAAIKNGPWLWNNRVSQATQPDHTGGESGADGIPALQIEDLTYRYPSGTLALN
ncbi:MAG: ABC transporter ATP-binding protein, partial [Chloroflexota bacterium]